MTQSGKQGGGELRSQLAGDADLAEVIREFVDEMPERIETLRALWEEQDLEALQRMAHQLKGSLGGYGFGVIGDAAATLDASLQDLAAGSDDAARRVQRSLAGLIELMRRARF